MSLPPSSAAPVHSSTTRLGGSVSLERKLPLLMAGFFAAGVAVMLFVTYLTLVRTAEAVVRDRLVHAARQIAGTAEDALTQIARAVREAADAEAVRAVLLEAREAEGEATPEQLSAARAALGRISPDRGGLPVELWDRDRRPVLQVGPEIPDRQRRLPELEAASGESLGGVRFGPLQPINGRAGYWLVAPVEAGGELLGFLVQPRYIGGPDDALQALRELLREEVNLYMRNADGSSWVAWPSQPVAAPVRRDSTASGIWNVRPEVGRFLAAEAPIAGTPWLMALETPERWILQRPRSTVATLAVVGLVLIVLGAAFSWVASRRISQPLAALTSAAEALALGKYEHTVTGAGKDEIGRLAASFDTMARQVAVARDELEHRVIDAQRVAQELELTNQQLRHAMQEAEAARAEAEHANRAKSDFLAVMSHELRTPLNAIGGYTQLLAMGIHGNITGRQREALERIDRSQAHLLTLINDVLNFARIDAGQVRYSMAAVAVDPVLVELESLLDPQVRAAGLRLEHGAVDPALFVHADRDKLRQVLVNLLANAIKYTPPGGSVVMECEADEQQVHIHVRDTGAGIRADRLPFIFEPFVQGERALNRPDEGVGLGLAISRDLARGMGGALRVESEVGRGSTFTLSLRRACPPRPLAPTDGASTGTRIEMT